MAKPTRTDQHHVLSTRTIVAWAIGLCLLATLSIVVLWSLLDAGGQRSSVRLDILRTAFSIVVGGGGAAGLLLAARRQRATELDIKQKDHDATETRVTELYGRAADQLGSDKAPVRLAGVLALERLAQGHPEHRQTIVDLVCAYLRMPFDPLDGDSGDVAQELEVRQTAQQMLISHMRPDDEVFWPAVRLNLAGATLNTLTFTRCQVRSASFAGARFIGPAVFRGSTFDQVADFRNVRFTGLADFRRVSFDGEGANFRGASFEAEVDFGQHTSAALTGALTAESAQRRKWPKGWSETPSTDRPGWAVLVRST